MPWEFQSKELPLALGIAKSSPWYGYGICSEITQLLLQEQTFSLQAICIVSFGENLDELL